MVLQFAQVRAIARSEFRMLWRGSTPLLILVGILALNVLVLISRVGTSRQDNSAEALIALSWGSFSGVLALFLPFFVADTIPKDRQLGVREILDAAPLTHNTYLAGKLIGACVGVLSTIFIVMCLVGLLLGLLVGSFDLAAYLERWVIGAGSLVVLNGGLGILLPAAQPTRRRAILLTVLLFFAFAFLFTPNPNQTNSETGTALLTYLNPNRTPIQVYYSIGPTVTTTYTEKDGMMTETTTLNTTKPYDFGDVLGTIAFGLLELALAWLLAWTWLSWQERQA